MKREEKNQLTRRRIMDSALAEFSKQGYGASSVNAICAAQDISKGIIYHYFAAKDDLFLACVEECFVKLTEYLKQSVSRGSRNPRNQLEEYFSARSSFFKENPVYQRIFCEATITPPLYLRSEIQNIRSSFDSFNVQTLEKIWNLFHCTRRLPKKRLLKPSGSFRIL